MIDIFFTSLIFTQLIFHLFISLQFRNIQGAHKLSLPFQNLIKTAIDFRSVLLHLVY